MVSCPTWSKKSWKDSIWPVVSFLLLGGTLNSIKSGDDSFQKWLAFEKWWQKVHYPNIWQVSKIWLKLWQEKKGQTFCRDAHRMTRLFLNCCLWPGGFSSATSMKLACKDPSFAQTLSFLQIRRGNFQNGLLDLNLHVLQVVTSNSNNWGRSVVQNCTSDTP